MGKIGSVTVFIEKGDTKVVILDGMPTEVKIAATQRISDGTIVRTSMDVFFKEICFNWNKDILMAFLDTIKYYRACFDRPMPLKEQSKLEEEKKGDNQAEEE